MGSSPIRRTIPFFDEFNPPGVAMLHEYVGVNNSEEERVFQVSRKVWLELTSYISAKTPPSTNDIREALEQLARTHGYENLDAPFPDGRTALCAEWVWLHQPPFILPPGKRTFHTWSFSAMAPCP